MNGETMQTKEAIEAKLDELKNQYGNWSYDIPLPHAIWTRGNLHIPHTRLKRIVQIIADLVQKPLSECRILDLGCLDGLFSIEFAKQGAQTVGVEIREANIKKAMFCKEILELDNLEFRQDDVRNISTESYGRFDAIVCSGILYHLPASDAINLIQRMFEMVDRLIVIDTHIALDPIESITHENKQYWGKVYLEHAATDTHEEKTKRLWASADNSTSFWFTRPSLVNILSRAGFSSVHECFTPPHLNFGKPGIEHQDRCTFAAIKGHPRELFTAPAANALQEEFPENSLSYQHEKIKAPARASLPRRIIARIRKMMP